VELPRKGARHLRSALRPQVIRWLKPPAQLPKRPLFACPIAGTQRSADLFALLRTSRSPPDVYDMLLPPSLVSARCAFSTSGRDWSAI
jgi:hypothetical protein